MLVLMSTPLVLPAQGPQAASSLLQRTTVQPHTAPSTAAAAERIMERSLSVNVSNVPLIDAARSVAKAANMKLTHTDDLGRVTSRVSLKKTNVTLKDAFSALLSGTEFQARIIPPNEVVITRRAKDAESQDSAVIRVLVVDSVSQQPVPSVMVEITGTNKRVLTDAKGLAVLNNLAPGEYRINARRLGYSTMSRTVTLGVGETIAVNFSLKVAANTLNEVITTGSGERTKLEVGTSIATIDAAKVMEETPVATLSELLATRVPGMGSLSSSGAVGSPKRFRIRGNSSIEALNEPLFILDGVRISNSVTTAQANSLFSGVVGSAGQNDFSQRLDDIDPNMIESIEVLKGPTASTLYGSEAANGVVIIKTKRGKAGPTRWSLYADHRELVQSKDYAFGIQQIGYPLAGGAGLSPACTLASMSSGGCIPIEGEFVGFNMLDDERFTPIGRGYTQSFGATASGGNDKLRFSLSATHLNQLGNAKLPNVNSKWIEDSRGGQKLSEEIKRPNARNNTSGSARIDGSLIGSSDFALSTTFSQSYMRAGNQGMTAIVGEVRQPTDTTPVTGWTDWNGTRTQDVKKINGSGVINMRPTWRDVLFTGSATYGWDFNLNDDVWYIPRGSCTPLCTSTTDNGVKGFVNAGRRTDFIQTFRLVGGGIKQVMPWMKADIRVGMDFSKTNYWWLYGSAADLRLGQKFYAANGTKNIQDIGDARATAGYFFEPTVSFRDRLYFTMGLRADAGSALGDEVAPKYPKYNVSWVLSEESFFPESWANVIDMFRLRAAYGKAGVLPTSNARIRTYSASTGFVLESDNGGSANGSYAQLTGPGNLWVRPELSGEYEGGFEIQFLEQRFGLDVTYFRKLTNDAIHGSPLAGSVGAGVTYTNKLNVGNVVNKGFEIQGNARLVDRDVVSYNVNGYVAQAKNKLTKMDYDLVSHSALNASGDVYTGNSTRVVNGYPLFGRWAYPILGYADANGNGFIDPNEVRVGDSLVYLGAPTPRFTAGVNHSLGFFRNLIMVNANFSYINGMSQFNTLRKDNLSRLAPSQGLGSLGDQACLVAASATGERRATDVCFYESTNTLRLENLAVSYQLSPTLAKKVRASSARIALNANNVFVWTNFNGRDPNVNSQPVNLNSAEAGSVFAAPREIGFRVSLTY